MDIPGINLVSYVKNFLENPRHPIDEEYSKGQTLLFKLCDYPNLVIKRARIDRMDQMPEAGKLMIKDWEEKADILVQKLLALGADPNLLDTNGYTPLHSIIVCNRPEIYLITAKTRINIVRNLLNAGAFINCLDIYLGRTPLILSAGGCSTWVENVTFDTELISTLLEYGADPNIKDKTNKTALMEATNNYLCPAQVVELLLKYGADPNFQDSQGRSPMFHVLKGSHYSREKVRVLLKYGAKPNMRDKKGRTPLFYFHYENCMDTLRLLIDMGCDINAQSDKGNTALITHISYDIHGVHSTKFVEELIRLGADVSKRNRLGENALGLAYNLLYSGEIIEALIMAGSDGDYYDRKGNIRIFNEEGISHKFVMGCIKNKNLYDNAKKYFSKRIIPHIPLGVSKFKLTPGRNGEKIMSYNFSYKQDISEENKMRIFQEITEKIQNYWIIWV